MEVLAGNFTSPHSEGGEIAEASGISCPLCEKHLSLLTWLSAIFLSIIKCVLTEDLCLSKLLPQRAQVMQ